VTTVVLSRTHKVEVEANARDEAVVVAEVVAVVLPQLK
jgi:hypothetical protein